MRGFVVVAALLLGGALGDSDYDNFMSSLSYNWQNEFADLRYQLDDMQRNDPDQYSQLAASMGLKPGTKISIPSEYSPEWASRFVAAAHLYTPPAPSAADTDAPTATGTDDSDDDHSGASSTLGTVHRPTTSSTKSGSKDQSDGSDDGDNMSTDDSGSGDSADGEDSESDSSPATSKSKSKSKSSTKSTASSDDGDADSDGGSTQFGNPIVGDVNNNTPIRPTGQGYSAAPAVRRPAAGTAGALLLMLLLGLAAA
ncbi:hypothetical protein H4R18_000270 [Coemansia javaensis]|uniref:Uncharacterized protein n=1 Tax=Coemansia javaensis TaxID=2761396 RepID=A0A9W8HLQ7_9FUNG|nr:hypothetical protein H4R18_000270 [Coemansia javaensis]